MFRVFSLVREVSEYKEMSRVYGIPRLYILVLIILGVHHVGSTQIVTCPEHGSAVLSFHFPFISGPEDLDITLLKMESIDRVTKRSVICALELGVWVYVSDHYKKRIKVFTDLSNGKLDLTLKDVEKEDEGIYKCQARNKENQGDQEIRLSVTNDTGCPCVALIIMIIINVIQSLFIIWTKRHSLRSLCCRKSQDYSETPQNFHFREEKRSDVTEGTNKHPVTTCDTERDKDVNNDHNIL